MKLIAEYKIELDRNYIQFYPATRNKYTKIIKMVTKRVIELKKCGHVIKNIKPKVASIYDEPWFYYHVRVWK